MADLNLNELDYDNLVQDAIFYILTQEQKRPIFYKGAVMKAIDYTSKPKESQDKIWNRTMRELEDVFGYFLSRVGTDGNGNKSSKFLLFRSWYFSNWLKCSY